MVKKYRDPGKTKSRERNSNNYTNRLTTLIVPWINAIIVFFSYGWQSLYLNELIKTLVAKCNKIYLKH